MQWEISRTMKLDKRRHSKVEIEFIIKIKIKGAVGFKCI